MRWSFPVILCLHRQEYCVWVPSPDERYRKSLDLSFPSSESKSACRAGRGDRANHTYS